MTALRKNDCDDSPRVLQLHVNLVASQLLQGMQARNKELF